MTHELPHAQLDFVARYIPSFQAAEVLVFFAANRDRDFTCEEVVAAMRPAILAVSAVQAYITRFMEGGLVTETNGRFTYLPTSLALQKRVSELVRAYHETPVTLITAIAVANLGHMLSRPGVRDS